MEQSPQTKTSAPPSSLRLIVSFAEKIEQLVLTLILLVLIVLACYQILIRWLTSGGVVWIDPLLRYLVLWGGLLGAVLATSKGNHIALDVIGYLVPRQLKKWLTLVTLCFSVVVSAFLFRAALLFIQSEMEFGGTTLFGISSWIWNLIFPIATGLICIHFFLSALLIITGSSDPGSQPLSRSTP